MIDKTIQSNSDDTNNQMDFINPNMKNITLVKRVTQDIPVKWTVFYPINPEDLKWVKMYGIYE